MGGGRGSPHPVMEGGQGRKSPPLPVRTIDKEWKASVSICMVYLFRHIDKQKSFILNVIFSGRPKARVRPTMGGPGMQPPQPKARGSMGV